MIKKTALISMVSIILFIVSCGQSKEKSQAHIKELEKGLFSNKTTIIEKKKSDEMIAAYMKYVKDFPKDTICANYLFQAASIQMNSGQPQKSVEDLDKIIKEYPKFRKIEDCYFLKGYVYENYIKDFPSAKKYYNEFILKFPKSELTDDAQIAIENMGLTPEEAFKKMEARANAKDDSIIKATKIK